MSSLLSDKYLIVGLGNPGRVYDETRHNIGFNICESLAKKQGWKFKPASHLFGEVAQGTFTEKKILVLLPMTYMNSSGESVQKCMSYFEVALERTIILADDIALPFGQLRMKAKGSAGGHNGLKSVEAHLGTQEYPRLRIGVGDRLLGDLSDHVLGKFTEEERAALPDIVEKALQALEIWIKEGINSAMRFSNYQGE